MRLSVPNNNNKMAEEYSPSLTVSVTRNYTQLIQMIEPLPGWPSMAAVTLQEVQTHQPQGNTH